MIGRSAAQRLSYDWIIEKYYRQPSWLSRFCSRPLLLSFDLTMYAVSMTSSLDRMLLNKHTNYLFFIYLYTCDNNTVLVLSLSKIDYRIVEVRIRVFRKCICIFCWTYPFLGLMNQRRWLLESVCP